MCNSIQDAEKKLAFIEKGIRTCLQHETSRDQIREFDLLWLGLPSADQVLLFKLLALRVVTEAQRNRHMAP